MDDKPPAMKDKARAKMMKYQRKFKDFIESNQEQGNCKSPYQPRVHGEDISLMTEIVYENTGK